MTNRKTSKLSDDNKSRIERSIDLLIARAEWAIPTPVGTSDGSLIELVESTIDPEVLAAIHTVQRIKPIGDYLLYCSVNTKVFVGEWPIVIRFDTPQPFVYTAHIANSVAGTPIPYVLNANHLDYQNICTWIQDMRAIKRRCVATVSLVKYVVSSCSTAGQITRAWPELIKFLPDEHKEALQCRTRASQLPKGIDMIRVNNEKHDATSVLALMSLLDETGKVKINI